MSKQRKKVLTEVDNRRFLSSLQAESQRREDDFMRLHGGLSARIIYRVVMVISFGLLRVSRFVAAIFNLFNSKKR